MKPIQACESSHNSYVFLNKEFRITSFYVSPFQDLGTLLAKTPAIGENIVEIIGQKFKTTVLGVLEGVVNGQGRVIEMNTIGSKGNDIILQLSFIPIVSDHDNFVICSVSDGSGSARQLKIINEYSHVTSHELRAPITNILSLSTIANYLQQDTYDYDKVRSLLTEINVQAEKIDDTITTLNKLLHKNETTVAFHSEFINLAIRHVVLIDDDPVTNRIHEMLISKIEQSTELTLFDYPEKALNYLQDHTPDLILLDLHMPEIDGWQFLEFMQALRSTIDVIIVSSSIDPLERLRAKRFSFVKDFISKPLTVDKVKKLFEQA